MREINRLYNDVSEMCRRKLRRDKPVGDVISACLRDAYARIMRAHFDGAGGMRVCAAHSLCIDRIVEFLVDGFVRRRRDKGRSLGKRFCVVAVGGYGRRELCPNSDVDIMFLYDGRAGEGLKTAIVDEIMYPLWNCGLKLGHSSRSVRETISDARSDMLSRNAMIDSRLIAGNKNIYSAFRKSFDSLCASMAGEHFNALMRLKRDRHAKYAWTPYLQEPNVKNGIGGLRDFQTMCWKTYLNFGKSDIRELARRKMISVSEYSKLLRAHDFILRVRNDLHYATGRQSDILDLEIQPRIASDLGFHGPDEDARVEAFMMKLYYSFRVVDTVAKAARKRMGLKLPDDVLSSMPQLRYRRPGNRKFFADCFSIWRGEVSVNALGGTLFNPFRADPLRLIRLFSICQEYGAAPDDRLEVLLKDSRGLISSKLRSDPGANSEFVKILTRAGNVFPALEIMHYWGVLGEFVPEFRDITCMVQHEFYHRYTADIHTLNSIAELDKIFNASPDDAVRQQYREILLSSDNPELAYLMLFLHDIGKADGVRGHAEVGAEIGARLLKRFGISGDDAETILFIVRKHLEMSRFWQSNDVDDERSAARFAEIVGDAERLKFLTVVTFCDAMATSETFWNSYKQGLHMALYKAALSHLRSTAEERISLYGRRREKLFRQIKESGELAGMEDALREHMENLPLEYFASHGRGDIVSHVGLISKLKSSKSSLPVIDWRDGNGQTSLCVVSTDRSGLFATLAGVLTLSGFDILGSKILTRPDGITIDTFYVSGIVGGASANSRMKADFARSVYAVLSGERRRDAEINALFYGERSSRRRGVSPEVSLRRDGDKFMLEVRAPDRVGLLWKIARTINECRYDVEFARINTEGGMAHDVFRVSPEALAEPPAELARSIRAIF